MGLGIIEILFTQISLFLIFVIPQILYIITLQNTLYQTSNENRKILPGQVWFILIPFFGFIWQFLVVSRIADSLKEEFASRSIPVNERQPGIVIGNAYCVLICAGLIPVLGILFFLIGIICWIIYWVRIIDYKNLLIRNSRSKI